MMCLVRVMQNVDLLRYGYDAIHLQYCDIQYDAVYRAITNLLRRFVGSVLKFL